ncbi:MAG: hypothetical protein WKF47_19975 [Geodermatophilaceae bacterium]
MRSAAQAARQRRPPERALPLVAVPAFGTAGGGGDRLRGELLDLLLAAANQVAREQQVDVAVVLRDPVDLAQAQTTRRSARDTWQVLGGWCQTRFLNENGSYEE